MQLYTSKASPFGRKVRACAHVREIDAQITVHDTDPQKTDEALWAANPLGKIPALVTEDGLGMYDSRVICEYLDTVGDAPLMFPEHGRARWRALLQQSTADGIMDAALLRRAETLRSDPRQATLDRQKAKIDRALTLIDGDLPHHIVDIGVISVACALGYLDFRFAHEPWRGAYPKLAGWFAEVAESPWMVKTAA